MQERIEHPRTQFVSVTSEFLDHFQAKDRSLACVMENMEADHSGIKHSTVVRGCSHSSLSDFDNELRYNGEHKYCQAVFDLATEVAGLRKAQLHFRRYWPGGRWIKT